jgi:hypothetical protein
MKTMRRGRLWRAVGFLVLIVLMVASMWSLPGGVGRAAGDPEPTVVQFPASNYDPGPGWPAGYTPPAPPTEIPARVRQRWDEDILFTAPADRPTQLVLRVLNPLPGWAQQFSYQWPYDLVTCGKTTYAYYYPEPDTDTYTAAKQFPGGCSFAPISSIKKDRVMTPEEQEQERLIDKMFFDGAKSRGGLPSLGGLEKCSWDEDGTPEQIVVCFNEGSAHPRFDSPAYLDGTIGRVRVPLRFVSEMMGAQVTWDGDARSVTIQFPAATSNVAHPVTNPGYQPKDWFPPEEYFPSVREAYKVADHDVVQTQRTIVVWVGRNTATIDGQEVTLDAPPVIQPPGRVMVPVRFIAERMGAKVYWVGRDPIFTRRGGTLDGRYQVHIYTPFHPLYEYPSWFLENRAQKF